MLLTMHANRAAVRDDAGCDDCFGSATCRKRAHEAPARRKRGCVTMPGRFDMFETAVFTNRITAALAAVTFVSITAVLQAQSPVDNAARFEVASVRPSAMQAPAVITGGAGGGPNIGVRGERFVAVNQVLREIIRYAYQLEPFQQIEGASPLLYDRFDITAVVPAGTPPDVPRLMLQTLLTERFSLRVRWTTRDQLVYQLIAGRRDKRLGPQLKPSTRDCDAWLAQFRREHPDGGRVARALSPKPICEIAIYPFRASIVGDTRTMADLARELSRIPVVGTTVLDRTGLTGGFDFELSFFPGPGAATALPRADEQPSLFVALDEQLGLRLERTRGPVRVLVVDRVEPLQQQ
jgi:uncharacterized protein (TIGR03435 family)